MKQTKNGKKEKKRKKKDNGKMNGEEGRNDKLEIFKNG